MAFVPENLVGRFVPDVGPLAAVPARHGLALELLVGHDAERRDDVLFEVLVLVVAPDQHNVWLEGIDLGPQPSEAIDQFATVNLGGCVALVVAPLGAHCVGPGLGVLLFRWDAVVVAQRPRERVVLQLVWCDKRRGVGKPDSKYLGHLFLQRFRFGVCPDLNFPFVRGKGGQLVLWAEQGQAFVGVEDVGLHVIENLRLAAHLLHGAGQTHPVQ